MKKYILSVCLIICIYFNIFNTRIFSKLNDKKNKTNNDLLNANLIVKNYNHFIDSTDGLFLYFKDGTKIEFDNKLLKHNYDDTLNKASLKDQMAINYIVGNNYEIPIKVNFEPGRVRCEQFFKKIYGDSKENVKKNLVSVNWLPNKLNKKILFNKLNGAAEALQNVSNELSKLPDSCIKYLNPIGGTYYWRQIAGTERLSMHSFGISIDINTGHSHYWRNCKPDQNGIYQYKNSIPFKIVEIFEKHGFIWGGKWYHFDTMHFEYRPELIFK